MGASNCARQRAQIFVSRPLLTILLAQRSSALRGLRNNGAWARSRNEFGAGPPIVWPGAYKLRACSSRMRVIL